jgi:hypothetical protein
MEKSSEKAIKNSFNKESKENSQKSHPQTVNNEKTTFARYTKNLNPPHMGHPSSRGNLPVKTSPFKQTPERMAKMDKNIQSLKNEFKQKSEKQKDPPHKGKDKDDPCY